MAIVFTRGAFPTEARPAVGRKARSAASPLGSLVRLLARQAAHEVVASGFDLYRAALDETGSDKNSAAFAEK
jgi:hypothetical protein